MNTKLRRWPWVCAAVMLGPLVCLAGNARAQSGLRPPEFVVDPTWPTIPDNWVLGEVTSVSVDRNDNIWVLHVPQSVSEDERIGSSRRPCFPCIRGNARNGP